MQQALRGSSPISEVCSAVSGSFGGPFGMVGVNALATDKGLLFAYPTVGFFKGGSETKLIPWDAISFAEYGQGEMPGLVGG